MVKLQLESKAGLQASDQENPELSHITSTAALS